MPLFKRKLYALSEPPQDLKASELVFQVRFTKEIFRDYQEYLKRINLYRQRVWTCKVTWKSNLTYEEALVSERRATEKIQHFPKEFMGPVLNMVQFSVIRLEELVNNIYKAFKDRFVVGEEIVGVQGDFTQPCKILKVIPVDEKLENDSFHYEVGWLDGDKNISRTSVDSAERLMRRKNPFTRALLKSFIRESAINISARGALWLVQEKLCRKYKILADPPEELRQLIGKQEPKDQAVNGGAKREHSEDAVNESQLTVKRRKKDKDVLKVEGGETKKEEQVLKENSEKVKSIRYPIDDLLVQPSVDNSQFTERPIPSSDFPLSMDCVGNLLMVWNFCTSFCRALHLSPFSLEEFERSLEYREGESPILRESNFALLRTALTDPVMYQTFAQKRRRKTEVSLQTWKDDLCDFLEAECVERFSSYISTIRRGYYRQLEPAAKLDILQALVVWALGSDVIRGQLDQYIEEKQAIVAQKRKEGSARVKEEQEQLGLAHPVVVEQAISEASTRVYPEENNLERVSDDEGLPVNKDITMNGWLSNDGAALHGGSSSLSENGDIGDGIAVSSRQSKVKLKAAMEQAEEEERQKRRIEEQKQSQEKRKAQAEALRERRLQEKKLVELQRRQEHLEREMEKRVIRLNPLGKDRNYNRYWFFQREGRIFVESEDSCTWGYYGAKEELDAFYHSLNPKGIRERALQKQLEKHFAKISEALQRRSKEIAQRIASEECSVRRSSRVKSTLRPTGFLAYVNKYRN